MYCIGSGFIKNRFLNKTIVLLLIILCLHGLLNLYAIGLRKVYIRYINASWAAWAKGYFRGPAFMPSPAS